MNPSNVKHYLIKDDDFDEELNIKETATATKPRLRKSIKSKTKAPSPPKPRLLSPEILPTPPRSLSPEILPTPPRSLSPEILPTPPRSQSPAPHVRRSPSPAPHVRALPPALRGLVTPIVRTVVKKENPNIKKIYNNFYPVWMDYHINKNRDYKGMFVGTKNLSEVKLFVEYLITIYKDDPVALKFWKNASAPSILEELHNNNRKYFSNLSLRSK